MPTKKSQQLTQKGIENLLSRQTEVILNAVDQKTTNLDKGMATLERGMIVLEKRIVALEERIDKMEIGINEKFDRLITTLDRFLKRLTDLEDEFKAMKADINRLKKIIREKLGVELQ